MPWTHSFYSTDLFQSVLNIGTRGAMATNVTLTKSSLVHEYLPYDGQDVIVNNTLTDAGECSPIL